MVVFDSQFLIDVLKDRDDASAKLREIDAARLLTRDDAFSRVRGLRVERY